MNWKKIWITIAEENRSNRATPIFNDLGGEIPRSKNFCAKTWRIRQKKIAGLFLCVTIFIIFLRMFTMNKLNTNCFCCNKKQTKNNPLVKDIGRMVCQPCHKNIVSERRYYASALWHGNPIKQ